MGADPCGLMMFLKTVPGIKTTFALICKGLQCTSKYSIKAVDYPNRTVMFFV